MRITGIQKLTLLDYPGAVACTLFTGGCNFRCPFCHNALLVDPKRVMEEGELPLDDVMDFLKKRRGVLDGVAITGGEPLLHSDMPEFLRQIKELGYRIKLDTNGSNPELLRKILDEKLVDRVAMDIKNSPELYAKTAGRDDVDIKAIEKSKDMLLQGDTEYEFRTTVVKGLHTKESLIEAAQWIKGAKEYYLQQFKDSGDLLKGEGLSEFNEAEMLELCDEVKKIIPAAKVRGV